MTGAKLPKLALDEYMKMDMKDQKQSHGSYQCFCEQELTRDYDYAMESDYGHPNGSLICADYDRLTTN